MMFVLIQERERERERCGGTTSKCQAISSYESKKKKKMSGQQKFPEYNIDKQNV